MFIQILKHPEFDQVQEIRELISWLPHIVYWNLPNVDKANSCVVCLDVVDSNFRYSNKFGIIIFADTIPLDISVEKIIRKIHEGILSKIPGLKRFGNFFIKIIITRQG